MSPITTRQKVGLALAGVLSASSISSAFAPAPDGEAPPLAIVVLGTILGVIGLIAVIIAWRGGKPAAIRLAAGALIINLLASLPAFFVDIPAGLKLLVGISVLLTVLAVALMFSPSRQPAPVLD